MKTVYKEESSMIFSSKTVRFFLFSTATVLLLGGCSPVGEEDSTGSVSTSTSSSETGDGFVIETSGSFLYKASVVIGQTNFTSNLEGTTAGTLSYPYGNPTVVDGMLYLPDTLNNRLVGHNTVPTNYPNSANFAIGQETLLDAFFGASAFENYGMQTVTVANGKLFATDWGNNRVLIYNQRPISGPGEANIVVGQTDFGNNGYATANNRLNSPESLYVTGSKLIVADSLNNRVLIWNTIPTTNGAAADIVLGQSNFTSSTINDANASTLYYPTAIWSDGTRLLVLDAGNNRVMLWNTFPTYSNQAATLVLGQSTFLENLPNQGNGDTPSQTSLSFSGQGGGLCSNGTQIFVADSGNNRIMIWDSFPITNGTPADSLIGQDGFDLGPVYQRPTPADNSFSNPTGVYQFSKKLIVTDTDNNRYLIFNSL